jgi:hypothetical protein
VTLREEHRLKVFENSVLRRILGPTRDEAIGRSRKIHSEELHNLYYLLNTIGMMKLRIIRWPGHVAHMREKRKAYGVLVGKAEGKRPLGRLRHRWEGNNKMDF